MNKRQRKKANKKIITYRVQYLKTKMYYQPEDKMKIYVSKQNEWYDEHTIAVEITPISMESGLFVGIKDGKIDQEICSYDEFDIHDTDLFPNREDT